MPGLRYVPRSQKLSLPGANSAGTPARYAACCWVLVLVAYALLACGSDPASSGRNDDRDERRATRRAVTDADRSQGTAPESSDTGRSTPNAHTYVPEVIGTKVFAARGSEDLEAYFSARGGRALQADTLFDETEQHFARIPQGEAVFRPDTPAIITVVLFDCRPTGNIRLEGATRLIDETVPGNPFLMYERPFSIDRRQTEDGFTISTSSGQGCMDNLNAGMPRTGWDSGPYRVEYRDNAGKLLVAIPFEVVGPTSSRIRSSDGLHGDGARSGSDTSVASHGNTVQLWIDVSLEPFRPGARIEVSSNVDIDPGDLTIGIDLDERGYRWGTTHHNANPIAGGAGFVPMTHEGIDPLPQTRWHENRLAGVSAVIFEDALACDHDVAASDRRRQHSFDERRVYSCTGAAPSSSGKERSAQSQTTPKDRFMESFVAWCATGENPAYCKCLGDQVFWSISTGHIGAQGGKQDLERPQVVFDNLRAAHGDQFDAMMSVVETEHGNAAYFLCEGKR